MRAASANRNNAVQSRVERGVHADSTSESRSAFVLEPTTLNRRTVKRRSRRAPFALLSAVAVATLLAGCATPVQTESKPGVNFSAYHTFALMPLPQTGPASYPGLMLRLGKPVQDATTRALTAKGFQAVARETA